MCDMACTFGFVDGVIFSRNGPVARHVYSWARIWQPIFQPSFAQGEVCYVWFVLI